MTSASQDYSAGGTGSWPGRLFLAALAVMLLWGPAGCDRATSWDDPGPDQVFRNYLMHWFKGEREQAFEMIAPEARKALTAPIDELNGNLENSEIPAPQEMLVAGRVDNPYDIKRIEVDPTLEEKPEPNERVRLALTYQDGRSGEATMVWNGERWYVDLPLEPGEASGRETHDQTAPPAEESRDVNSQSDVSDSGVVGD